MKRPTVAKKTKRIITSEQFDRFHAEIGKCDHDGERMQLLVETDIETGMRWGELTELRVKDLDPDTAMITVARVVLPIAPAPDIAEGGNGSEEHGHKPPKNSGPKPRPPTRSTPGLRVMVEKRYTEHSPAVLAAPRDIVRGTLRKPA